MMKKILVTGATGNVGGEVIKFLLKSGHPIKAAVRGTEVDKYKSAYGGSLEVVHFDFEKPDTFKAAFEEVDRIFLMRPPTISDVKKHINPAIDYAIQSGVEHIVLLSLLGAESNPLVPHHKIEKHILKSNIAYTFLRPSFFMQNLTGFFRELINKENIVFAPAGKGRTSFIDVRDIAEVGAVALLDPCHRNKAYPLTGNEALDYYDVADILSEELGRKITYANPSPGTFKRKLEEMGMSKDYIKVLTAIFFTARIGLAKKVTADTELLLGKPPITVRQFVKDYAKCWM